MGLGAVGLASLRLLNNKAYAGFAQSAGINATDLAVLNFALNLEYLVLNITPTPPRAKASPP